MLQENERADYKQREMELTNQLESERAQRSQSEMELTNQLENERAQHSQREIEMTNRLKNEHVEYRQCEIDMTNKLERANEVSVRASPAPVLDDESSNIVLEEEGDAILLGPQNPKTPQNDQFTAIYLLSRSEFSNE